MAALLAIACSSYHLAVRPIAPASPASRRVASIVGCDREPGQLGGGMPPPAGDEGEEEAYLSALAEARLASAKLQDAELRLRQAAERRPAAPAVAAPAVAALATKPVGARTSISRSDAGTLLVEVPPAGFNAAGTLMGGAFTAAWFSAIVRRAAACAAPVLGHADVVDRRRPDRGRARVHRWRGQRAPRHAKKVRYKAVYYAILNDRTVYHESGSVFFSMGDLFSLDIM